MGNQNGDNSSYLGQAGIKNKSNCTLIAYFTNKSIRTLLTYGLPFSSTVSLMPFSPSQIQPLFYNITALKLSKNSTVIIHN
jgi:hypothetical protein